MRTVDFSPMFRSTVGFDRMARLVDSALRSADAPNAPSYPPYDIEKVGENDYRISMAVAGFADGEIDISVEGTTLTVIGKKEQPAEGEKRSYLHRGIAARAFERRFEIAEFIKVTGARLENGLLHVDLVREVPEEKRPRKIAIDTGAPKLESKAA